MIEFVEKIRKSLDKQEEKRERLLDISHKSIRQSSSAMAALHRGEFDRVSEKIEEIREEIEKLNELLESSPQFTDHGTLIAAHREFSEIVITKNIIQGKGLPDPDKLNVHYKGYTQAMPEAIGELHRHVLNLLRDDEVRKAEKIHQEMERIFDLLEQFDYPDSILPGVKHRRDGARDTLKKTRDAVTRAVREQKLENALKRTERKLEKSE